MWSFQIFWWHVQIHKCSLSWIYYISLYDFFNFTFWADQSLRLLRITFFLQTIRQLNNTVDRYLILNFLLLILGTIGSLFQMNSTSWWSSWSVFCLTTSLMRLLLFAWIRWNSIHLFDALLLKRLKLASFFLNLNKSTAHWYFVSDAIFWSLSHISNLSVQWISDLTNFERMHFLTFKIFIFLHSWLLLNRLMNFI